MKNKMKRITLLTLGLISAGATLHGCDAQDCTEMGCTDNYTLSLQAPGTAFQAGSYDFAITFDGAVADDCGVLISDNSAECPDGLCIVYSNCDLLQVADRDLKELQFSTMGWEGELPETVVVNVARDNIGLVERTLNPTYEDICTGQTGHAEVIKITYDPVQVSYAKLLETFGVCHDPTTLNRQGADEGTQYRSVIMYHNEEQMAAAGKWKIEVAKEHVDPIVTEIVEAPVFYVAEEGHQDFFRRNPNAGYCTFVIRPKLEKVKEVQEKEK